MGSYNPKGILMAICDALRDLVPFVQFENREKHPWRSVNFSKVAGFKRYRISQRITYNENKCSGISWKKKFEKVNL